jgi:hypothetical protein
VREPTDERLVARRDKLRTEEGQALDGRRNHTVEPVFGIIKAALGFHGFSLRDKESFLPWVADSHAQIPKNSENNNIRPLAIKMSCGLREGPSRLTTHRIYRFGTGKVERLRLGVSPARLRRLLAVRSYEKLFCRGQKVRTQFPARLLRPQQRFL